MTLFSRGEVSLSASKASRARKSQISRMSSVGRSCKDVGGEAMVMGLFMVNGGSIKGCCAFVTKNRPRKEKEHVVCVKHALHG